ncbi:MAG: ABC transporter permease, partial [Acidobacteriota bacterium]
KDGLSVEKARAEMDTIGKRLEQQYPDFNTGWGVTVAPLHQDYVGDLRTSLLVLFAAVGVVLLIACANVANLLLARASTRGREMALRLAMGAGRWRLARQLLTESLVLALLGGLAGLGLAFGAVRLLAAFLPDNLPLPTPSVDWTVAAFMAGLAVLTGILFGLAPAWEAFRSNLGDSLQEGRSNSGSAQSHRMRHLLVVAEVALALVLLTGAGLLVRSFLALQSVDPGFNSERILTMQVQLPGSRYDAQARLAFFEESLQRFRSLPGVEGAAANAFLPMSGPGSGTMYVVDDQPDPGAGQQPVTDIRPITSGYFKTMGIPLLEGRDFDSRDSAASAAVAIVNKTLAETHWPGQSPLGKTLSYSWGQMLQVRIIGVAGDVKVRGPQGLLRSLLYLPNAQNNSFPFMTYVVRSSGDPLQLAPSLVAEVRAIDPNLPVSKIRPLSSYLVDAVARPRLNMYLLGLFSLTALVLASVGIFGVLSYNVSQRLREIGIRMALGARPGEVLRMVIGGGFKLTLIGLGLGLAGSLLLSRFLGSLLFEVSPTDPWTFTLVALLLAGIALAACYLPARRAGKLDPMKVLRME